MKSLILRKNPESKIRDHHAGRPLLEIIESRSVARKIEFLFWPHQRYNKTRFSVTTKWKKRLDIFSCTLQVFATIHPFTHSSIHSFLHSSIHSFIHRTIELIKFDKKREVNGTICTRSKERKQDNRARSQMQDSPDRSIYLASAILVLCHSFIHSFLPSFLSCALCVVR